MIKWIQFFATGIFFGIIMTKSEAISWFRIQEMFRFESFHMYGIMGTAVAVGVLGLWLMRKMQVKDVNGELVVIPSKEMGIVRYLAGGTLFGLGWAMTGACPGPLYVLLGHGYGAILVVILSAILGTFTYGIFRSKLPH